MEKVACFVCKNSLPKEEMAINKKVLLPVCPKCKGTNNESEVAEEYLNSLADGLVCGCI